MHASHTGALAAAMHFHGTKPSEALSRSRLIWAISCRHPQEDRLAARPSRLEARAKYGNTILVIANRRAAIT